MRHPKASWFDPDKIIKDILWRDISHASQFAKGKLLDIGCGSKPYKQLFNKTIQSYVGIDRYNSSADIKQNFFTASLKPKSFDTVLCTQVIEHVSDPSELLIKIKNVLKKDGIIILTAPLVAALHEEPNDYYRFTKYALKNLFKDTGFTIINLKEEGNWITSNITMIAFYLEGTCNRYFLRYPKKLLILSLMLLGTLLSHLPKHYTKPEKYPMNYLVIAKKIQK